MLSTHCLAAAFVKVTIRTLASSKLPCIKTNMTGKLVVYSNLKKLFIGEVVPIRDRWFFLFQHYTSMFREEATSALTDFHVGPVSWLHRNLEC